MQNETALATSVKQKVSDLLEQNTRLLEVMLEGIMTTERFKYIALNTLCKPGKNLLACDPKSFMRACLQSASTGLEVDTPLQEATIIAYGNQANFQPMYRGLVKLARQSGAVVNIEARVVFEGDIFEVDYGVAKNLVHRPKFLTDDLKKITYAYSIARMTDGSVDFEVMTRVQIEQARSQSKAGTSLMWTKFYEEGAKKAVMRRHSKRLPAGYKLAVAVDLDNAAEAGKPQEFNPPPEVGAKIDISMFSSAEEVKPEPEKKTKAEKITEKIKNGGGGGKPSSGDDLKKPPDESGKTGKSLESGSNGSGGGKEGTDLKKLPGANEYNIIFECGCDMVHTTVPTECPEHPGTPVKTYTRKK